MTHAHANTYGRTTKEIGGSLPVWREVRRLYQSGGRIDITGLSPGDTIVAGSMCYLDFAGGTLQIVKDTDPTADQNKVNGLLFNDVHIFEGDTYATGAVVYDGDVYAERIPTVPVTVQNRQLSMIHFTKER